MSTLTRGATTAGLWIVQWICRLFHPQTIVEVAKAIGRGGDRWARWSHRYVTAADREDLRKAGQRGPEKHLALAGRRKWYYWTPITAGLIGAAMLLGKRPLWVGLPFTDARLPMMLALEVLIVLIPLFLAGRTIPILPPMPKIGRVPTEWFLVTKFNELALTKAELRAWKEDPRIPYSAQVVEPVVQLANGKGYRTRLSLPGDGTVATMVDRTDDVAAKLHVDDSQVFMHRVKGAAHLLDLLVLYRDPWADPSPMHPLVLEPRPVDLWTQPAILGQQPTGDTFTRQIQQKGGGRGTAIGAIPRQGKTVLELNYAVNVVLDPYAMPLVLDPKGVDLKFLAPLCPPGWGYLARPSARQIIAQMSRVVDEIGRRNKILDASDKVSVDRELCRSKNMPSIWYFVDELSEILDSPDKVDKEDRETIVGKLNTIARLGPTVSVYIVAATQRISEASMPPSFRDLLPDRYALKCTNPTAARMVLGKGGLENRADKLSEDEKGVAITSFGDVIRTFHVHPEDHAAELRELVEYGLKLRREAGTLPQGGDDVAAPAGPGDLIAANESKPRPPIVDAVLSAMDSMGYDKAIPTRVLLTVLNAPGRGFGHRRWTDERLAAALAEHGVSASQDRYPAPTPTAPKKTTKARGYRRADLLQAVETRPTPSGPAAPGGARAPGSAPEAGARPQGTAPEAGDEPLDDEQDWRAEA